MPSATVCDQREITLSGCSSVTQRRVNARYALRHFAHLRIMSAVLRLCVLILISTLSVAALAVDSDETSGQFTYTSRTSKDGVPGMVQALAQTPNGFLWLGTYEGLFRFDGASFDRIPVAKGHPPGSIPVSALLVTRAGNLGSVTQAVLELRFFAEASLSAAACRAHPAR